MTYRGFKTEVIWRLDKIIQNQETAAQQRVIEMSTMTELVAKISEETTLVSGLKTFVQGLRDQISALPNITPAMQADIDSAFASVTANSTAIANAMVVNTPPTS
jgi:hypothetical protein